MPRTTTAKQVKRTRRTKKIFLVFLAVILCVALFLGIPYVVKERAAAKDPLLDPYGTNASGSVFTADRPSLFAENLCVVTGDSEADPAITAEAGILFDRTNGQVIFSKNAHERLYPASITKLMTCLVALRHGDLSQEILVEDYMLANLDPESSVCHIAPGCTLTLEQLLYGLMIPSGNDAANAIAYGIAGSEEAFADLMNEEARRIGATESHFVNAHGLNDPDHYTTAYDIYLIFNELMNYDKFVEIITTQSYRADFDYNGVTTSLTWDRGIWYFNGRTPAPEGVSPIGGKTGTTPEAGYCLSLISSDGAGNQYISVVLKTGNREELYSNMSALLSKIPN